MLVTLTSVLPVARTRGTGGSACATADLRPGALYASATPRGAEHVAVVVRRDETGGSGSPLLGRVQRHALAAWSTSRPTTFPRGESSAPSAPV